MPAHWRWPRVHPPIREVSWGHMYMLYTECTTSLLAKVHNAPNVRRAAGLAAVAGCSGGVQQGRRPLDPDNPHSAHGILRKLGMSQVTTGEKLGSAFYTRTLVPWSATWLFSRSVELPGTPAGTHVLAATLGIALSHSLPHVPLSSPSCFSHAKRNHHNHVCQAPEELSMGCPTQHQQGLHERMHGAAHLQQGTRHLRPRWERCAAKEGQYTLFMAYLDLEAAAVNCNPPHTQHTCVLAGVATCCPKVHAGLT